MIITEGYDAPHCANSTTEKNTAIRYIIIIMIILIIMIIILIIMWRTPYVIYESVGLLDGYSQKYGSRQRQVLARRHPPEVWLKIVTASQKSCESMAVNRPTTC